MVTYFYFFQEYPKIVRKPMDFALVESRLKEHYYNCAAECVDDIETIFANCCIFNQSAEVSSSIYLIKYLGN